MCSFGNALFFSLKCFCPNPCLCLLWFSTPFLVYLVRLLYTSTVTVEAGNGQGNGRLLVFSLWLCDTGFNMTRSTAKKAGWAGQQGSWPVPIQIPTLLQGVSRIGIPKITSSRELEKFSVNACFPSVSSLSVLSCQSSTWGGSRRLHDAGNDCNAETQNMEVAISHLIILYMKKP